MCPSEATQVCIDLGVVNVNLFIVFQKPSKVDPAGLYNNHTFNSHF